MKTLFSILIFSLLLFSCVKKKNIHITAKNAVTGQPYAGLHYKVVQERTGLTGEKFKTVASGTLDANGEASFSKKLIDTYSYAVTVEEPSNCCYNKQITYYFANRESNFECPFEFAECAYLKFRYKNTSCVNSNDHIEVTRLSTLPDYVGFYNPATYDGCADYTMPDFVKVPMGTWNFTWKVTKNGITTNYSDQIFLNANEYKYYEFNY